MTLLAVVANDPDQMPSLMFALNKELGVTQSVPGSAWGVGYYSDDRALTVHKPAELVVRKGVHGVAPDVRSRILLAGHSAPQRQHPALDRAPPHRFRRWLFACRGDLSFLDEMRGRIREKLPDFLGVELGDGSASELAFGMFLAELRRDGVLDDPLATPEDHRAACARAFDLMGTLMAEVAGTGKPVPAAFALSNGRSLMVVRGSESVRIREQVGLDQLPEGPLDPARTDFNELAQTLKRFRAVILAAGIDSGQIPAPEAWTELPAEQTWALDLQLQWTKPRPG